MQPIRQTSSSNSTFHKSAPAPDTGGMNVLAALLSALLARPIRYRRAQPI